MADSLRSTLVLIGLFVCFFLSGAAALVYEVVWMRMLTQIFGSSAYAVATVLSAFMAGLALGSYVFGRLVDQEKNYLRLYALLELGIGIYGFLVPIIFKSARSIYIPLFWLYDSSPGVFNLLLFLLAFGLIAIPTFLMGATLPVLSRYFVRSFSHLGQRIGDLYGTNTLGAVLGCGLAGYYLIPAIGISRSLYSAAGLNLFVAVVIFLLDGFSMKKTGPEFLEERESLPKPGPSSRSSLEWILLASIGISGAAAMIYENAWTHALTLVIGGSVYSFSTMLVTFLTGLALGGYLYARLFGRREVRVGAFGLLELGVGVTALATIPLFEKLPLLFLRFYEGFGNSFPLFLTIQIVISSAVMFLPTLLLGMTFPLVVRLFIKDLHKVGSGVGVAYASNTVGAICGAFLGGFVLLPLVGMQNSIIVGAFLNLITGWLLLVADPQPGRIFRLATGGLVAMLLLFLALRLPSWDRLILTSGVTIYANRLVTLPTDSLRLEEMRRDQLLYYREGLTATVSVHQPRKDYIYLKTNGKTDGSHGDALTMFMTGYLPMLFVPEAEQVAIIGLGTGMTAKAVGSFPVKKMEILEIEPAMVEAAAFFKDKNGKILEDPRVRLIPSDGRNYMMATPHRYDLIISEPSNPWIAGIASLFTEDFYAVARRKLKPEGLFAQWIHNYSMSPDDFRMVLRSFGDSFSHVSVWNLQESDFLLLGSLNEHKLDYPKLNQIFSENGIMRSDFKELGLSDVFAALGFYRMGKKELSAFAEGAERNTDDNALLEFSAPRNLGKITTDLNRGLMETFLSPPPWDSHSRWLSRGQQHYYLGQALRASGWLDRALKEADQATSLEPNNADYQLLRAQILTAQDKIPEALKAAEKVLDQGPEHLKQVLALTEEFYTQQAIIIYSRAIKLNPKEIVPYLGLGNIALHRKNLEEAAKWFQNASTFQPEHPAVLLALGKLASARGNHSEALSLLEESKNKGEDSATLYSELGKAYNQLQQWEKAALSYELALRHQRRNIQWRLSLADALAKLGRVKQAELKYREVLALNPNQTDAWRGLRNLGKRY